MGSTSRPKAYPSWFVLVSLVLIQVLLQSRAQTTSCTAPSFRVKPSNFTLVEVGMDIKLSCQINQQKKFIEYYWLKNGHRIYMDNNPRMRIKPLKYLKVKQTRSDDSGVYQCVAKNKCGFVDGTIKLQVKSPTLDPSDNSTGKVPPKLIVNPHKRHKTLIAVPVGNSVRLDCSAKGNPQPVVRWYKDGKKFNSRDGGVISLSSYDFVLQLRDVVPNDSGKYTCNVTNDYGWFNHTYRVDVRERVRAKPVILSIDNVTAWVGENVTLACKAMSDSMPHFQWIRWFTPYFNVSNNSSAPFEVIKQKAVDPSSHILRPPLNRKFAFHGVKLTLYNVSKKDEGRYSCVVGNAVGYSYEHGFLIVKDGSATDPPTTALTERLYIEGLKTSTTASVAEIKKQEPKQKGFVVIISVVGAVSLFLIILIVVVYVLWTKRRSKNIYTEDYNVQYARRIEQNSRQRHPSVTTSTSSYGSTAPLLRKRDMRIDSNLSQVSEYELPLDEEWELDRSLITVSETLGEGAFGRVMKAEAIGLKKAPYSSCFVAVKMLKDDATEQELSDLISEMETMKRIGQHKNIINLIGACTQNGPLFVVVEYAANGNLRQFLRSRRPTDDYSYSSGKERLHLSDLVSFAYQVSRGMAYLEAKKCIHRDLAARNVLVSEDLVLKIADFGLARDVHDVDYYRKTTDGRLPVMWMALEALFDRVYTAQSDVWAFGILMWEIVTFGGSPYPGVPLEKLFELLKSGYRMEQPVNCDDEMYALMIQCWHEDPARRPTFNQLVKELDAKLTVLSDREYLDLSNVCQNPIAPPHTPTSSESVPTPRESLSSSVFESNENIWGTMESEPHRNAGFLNSPRTFSESTENKNTDKDQRDSGVGMENTTNQNVIIDNAKKTVFFREPIHSVV
ncbi:fibroblast growth factor receptor 2-like [Actinia tenebrosa]|uniref:Fibroblast growth factor receptor n=1 Tax=Actinia tenebrosa TaxID=6105 RepID=A0A6P8HRF0_ACTTE|nr:fibroblast growth factor receptor 2-like [Actinia tenebrosa]XP_031555249.1 fibroblast growth factor receptor 2-like [Actinia tenebrosa]XP_031555257.1 fibroblast growth factor receptor 2-like [Actinia tenebrosa]XP_031555266.1 fibroblast growth factor receptor 2-like [Actinia tenebrosa]XP_031555275.1 fibroblast growth factor receptor 2-like [Actinia tenebrosa]